MTRTINLQRLSAESTLSLTHHPLISYPASLSLSFSLLLFASFSYSLSLLLSISLSCSPSHSLSLSRSPSHPLSLSFLIFFLSLPLFFTFSIPLVHYSSSLSPLKSSLPSPYQSISVFLTPLFPPSGLFSFSLLSFKVCLFISLFLSLFFLLCLSRSLFLSSLAYVPLISRVSHCLKRPSVPGFFILRFHPFAPWHKETLLFPVCPPPFLPGLGSLSAPSLPLPFPSLFLSFFFFLSSSSSSRSFTPDYSRMSAVHVALLKTRK